MIFRLVAFFMVIVDILHRKKKTTLKFSSYVSKNDKKKNLTCFAFTSLTTQYSIFEYLVVNKTHILFLKSDKSLLFLSGINSIYANGYYGAVQKEENTICRTRV